MTSIVVNNDIDLVKRETVLTDSIMAQLLNSPTSLTSSDTELVHRYI